MVYARPFVKIDIIGDCYDGSEIWNTGLKLGRDEPGIIGNGVLVGAAESVAVCWEDFFTEASSFAGSGFSANYRTLEVKASHIGTDGYVVGNTHTYFYDNPIVGARANSTPLPQAAMVGSFGSAVQRGPASRGRMYLPGIDYSVGDDALNPVNATETIADNFNAFVNAINGNTIGDFFEFTVVLASPVGDGRQETVTTTAVDRKVDTQRRRANAIESEYYAREVLFI